MLLSEYATNDVAEFRRQAANDAAIEIFVRDGAAGALVITDADETVGHRAGKVLASRFDGGRFGMGGGPWLFHVALWTPNDYRDEFLAWYQIEHLPMLLECPVWDGCRFMEETVKDGCQFHALHQFSEATALDSEERKRSRSTPWFNRLSKNEWFDGAFKRTLYKRVS